MLFISGKKKKDLLAKIGFTKRGEINRFELTANHGKLLRRLYLVNAFKL